MQENTGSPRILTSLCFKGGRDSTGEIVHWGVDTGIVFGWQRGKTRTPIQASAFAGAFLVIRQGKCPALSSPATTCRAFPAGSSIPSPVSSRLTLAPSAARPMRQSVRWCLSKWPAGARLGGTGTVLLGGLWCCSTATQMHTPTRWCANDDRCLQRWRDQQESNPCS